MASKVKLIRKRKKDHLKIALAQESQVGSAGFEKYRLIHNALPEINFDEINTSIKLLGKTVKMPFFISCMTGGIKEGARININLATAAQKYGIAMGVGSQRIAIEHPQFKYLFNIRKFAPSIPLVANVGLVQLNYGFGIKDFEEIIRMIDADALAIHLNPIQEVLQPEGDRNWKKLSSKLARIIDQLTVPVIIKEVGFGLSTDVARRLGKIGVRYLDTAGWGGTNWAYVEGNRSSGWKGMGQLFSNWGITTTDSIVMCKKVSQEYKNKIKVFASGGIRNGIDIAKAIALGADAVGLALPFLKEALISTANVNNLIERLTWELKIAMFGVGAKDINSLKKVKLLSI